MKLIKEKKGEGYIISVLMGTNGKSSYWDAPPIYGKDNHHYNFEKEYLISRYPMINTKEKAETFSRLYKNLWIEVSPYQTDLMKHCIGLDYKKKPYRNYFCTSPEDKDWTELVSKGLAAKSNKEPNNSCIYFWLSRQGVEYVLGRSVSEKVYKKM